MGDVNEHRVAVIHAEKMLERIMERELRVVCLHEDNATVVIATMQSGAPLCTTELAFRLDDATATARAILAGNTRAMTRPGLARMLAGTIAVFAHAGLAAGICEREPDAEPAPAENDTYPDSGEGVDDE